MKGNLRKAFWVAALAAAFALSAVASTATTAYDNSIRASVTKKLADKSELREVQAAVEDGIVTLTGTVASYPDKLEAAKKAKADHVAGVRNLIEVSATSIADSDTLVMLTVAPRQPVLL